MTRPTRLFWKRHLGQDWETRLMYPELWKIISDRELITDEEIWALRYHLRRELIEFARKRLRDQYQRGSGDGSRVFEKILYPDALRLALLEICNVQGPCHRAGQINRSVQWPQCRSS
jgi:starch phosphorylase